MSLDKAETEAKRDRGMLSQSHVHRPRAYPYNPATILTVTAGAGENNFGDYVELIPKETYDFGDTPNEIHIMAINLESVSEIDTYVLEFYESEDGVAFTPLGNVRPKRIGNVTRSMRIDRPCRDYDCDVAGLYARLKSALGSNNVTLSLSVSRHLDTEYMVPGSPGVWPTG